MAALKILRSYIIFCYIYLLDGITGTLKTEGGISECKWKENKPNGDNKLTRSLKLTCKCASADNDNGLVHYGCQYVGDPHNYDDYNKAQVTFYKKMAQSAASMIMT